jgi:hypothetical protein
MRPSCTPYESDDRTAISGRLFLCYTDHMDTEQRNALRAEARLPLLDAAAEAARLAKAREQAQFENYFRQNRDRYAHLWSDRNRGFWTNMAIYNAVRKELREEMRHRND